MIKPKEWIGVDLDGTLAEYNGFIAPEHIGKPVQAMIGRVLFWRSMGMDVRIFTARANPHVYPEQTAPFLKAIRDWMLVHLGEVLPVVYEKCPHMHALWDDKAIHVKKNTGEFVVSDPEMLATLGLSPKPEQETVPQIMRRAADTYEERNALYKDNYKRIGETLQAMFPHGIKPETPNDWNRFALCLMIVFKISRYCANPEGHKDSAHDSSVYSAMLEELTNG